MPYANYKKVHKAVRELIKKLKVKTMPIDPLWVLDQCKIPCISYSEALSYPQFKKTIFNLKKEKVDAFCYKSDNDYIVFFDDQVQYKDRIPFSIAHEIGHIMLHHHTPIDNGIIKRYQNITNRDYREIEADEFAGELLASAALIKLSGLTNLQDIHNCFKVSYSCAKVSLKKSKSLSYLTIEENINFYRTQFNDYLSDRYCPICHARYHSTSNTCCPFCGRSNTFWAILSQRISDFFKFKGEFPLMFYNKYQGGPNGQVFKCPNCENERLEEDWYFCPICGLETTNKCTNCNKLLQPNYRFCPDCGNESLYFSKKAIVTWREEKIEAAQINESEWQDFNTYSDEANIPF